ncbi:MAG: hypothetical protein Q9162_002294 [Coniocarpon cinnabarinum]
MADAIQIPRKARLARTTTSFPAPEASLQHLSDGRSNSDHFSTQAAEQSNIDSALPNAPEEGVEDAGIVKTYHPVRKISVSKVKLEQPSLDYHTKWIETFLRLSNDQALPSNVYLLCARDAGQDLEMIKMDLSGLETQQELARSVKSFLSTLKLKALIVCHPESCGIGRAVLEYLRHTFSVDTAFLRQHLFHEGIVDEESCNTQLREWCRQFIDVHSWPTYQNITEDVALPSDLSSKRLHLNFEFHPWGRLVLREHQWNFFTTFGDLSVMNMSQFAGKSPDILEHAQTVLLRREEIIHLQRKINNFLGLYSRSVRKDEPLKTFFHDIDDQQQSFLSARRIFDAYQAQSQQNHTSDLVSRQLKETQKSIQSAISVQRLSRLGFVYIPLNFVCAMLSMNMAAFGQGTLSMWLFFLLGLLFIALTTMPLLFATELERLNYETARIGLQIAWRSPVAAFCRIEVGG